MTMKPRSPLRSPNSDAGSAADADALLAHAGFLRALTRGLLLDDQQADDVIQQTVLAAMSRERAPRNPRAWLATVAKNFARMTARSESRRTQRERDAARPESGHVASRLEIRARKREPSCVPAMA